MFRVYFVVVARVFFRQYLFHITALPCHNDETSKQQIPKNVSCIASKLEDTFKKKTTHKKHAAWLNYSIVYRLNSFTVSLFASKRRKWKSKKNGQRDGISL